MHKMSEQTIYGQIFHNGAVARAFNEQCIWVATLPNTSLGYILDLYMNQIHAVKLSNKFSALLNM